MQLHWKKSNAFYFPSRSSLSGGRRSWRPCPGVSAGAESSARCPSYRASLLRLRREGFPISSEGSAFQAAREIRNFLVHVRRREPGGYVRLQADAREVSREAARRQR